MASRSMFDQFSEKVRRQINPLLPDAIVSGGHDHGGGGGNGGDNGGGSDGGSHHPLVGKAVSVAAVQVQVEKLLAEGGFAQVFAARQVATGTPVALKTIAVPDVHMLRQFQHEINIMKQLRGKKHIITMIASEVKQGQGGTSVVYILMELCPGSLVQLLNQRMHSRMSEGQILKIFSEICVAVSQLHYEKVPIAHRDIKVENVLFDVTGSVRLCDFGSATTKVMQVTSTRDIVNAEEEIQRFTTLAYRAPEMVDLYQKHIINESVDIWALGCLLYKMCYYVSPFEDQGALAILNSRYTFPETPEYPQALQQLIAYCLTYLPEDRPNIYQVLARTSEIRGVPCPIQNIYPEKKVLPKEEKAEEKQQEEPAVHPASQRGPSPPSPRGPHAASTSAAFSSSSSQPIQPQQPQQPPVQYRRGRARRNPAENAQATMTAPTAMTAPAEMAGASSGTTGLQSSANAKFFEATFPVEFPESEPFDAAFAPAPEGAMQRALSDELGEQGGGGGGGVPQNYFEDDDFGKEEAQPQQPPPQQPAPPLVTFDDEFDFSSSGSLSTSSASAASLAAVAAVSPMAGAAAGMSSGASSEQLAFSVPATTTATANATADFFTHGRTPSNPPSVPLSPMDHDFAQLSVTKTPSPVGSLSSVSVGSLGSVSADGDPHQYFMARRMVWLGKLLVSPTFKQKYLLRVITEVWRCVGFGQPPLQWIFQDLNQFLRMPKDPLPCLRALLLIHQLMLKAPPQVWTGFSQHMKTVEEIRAALANRDSSFNNINMAYCDFLLKKHKLHEALPSVEGSFSLEQFVDQSLQRAPERPPEFLAVSAAKLLMDHFGAVSDVREAVMQLPPSGGADVRFWLLVALMDESAGLYDLVLHITGKLKELNIEASGVHLLTGKIHRLYAAIKDFFLTVEYLNAMSAKPCAMRVPPIEDPVFDERAHEFPASHALVFLTRMSRCGIPVLQGQWPRYIKAKWQNYARQQSTSPAESQPPSSDSD